MLEERRASAVELTEEEQQREREREAVAEKKRWNAQRVKSSALKNKIKRTQEELAIQRATIRQLKKDGLLTKETKEAIEARRTGDGRKRMDSSPCICRKQGWRHLRCAFEYRRRERPAYYLYGK